MQDFRARISVDPHICHGQACIKGTRVLVSLIVDFLANGNDINEILQAYPSVTREDVLACLGYAAEMTRQRVVSVDLTG